MMVLLDKLYLVNDRNKQVDNEQRRRVTNLSRFKKTA